MEDSDIIALYFACAESAVSETVKKYGAYLNAVAYNILRSREDAEECVADTYIAAWNTIPPERPRSLRCYLARIARSRACDRRDCAVFVSRYYYGRSARETASRLGLTERQVKYRLARTRASLKTYLETEGVEL